jgi:hypothetical protein
MKLQLTLLFIVKKSMSGVKYLQKKIRDIGYQNSMVVVVFKIILQ